MNTVITAHLLDFEIAPWHKSFTSQAILDLLPDDDSVTFPEIEWELFRVGTCEGQFRVTPEAYEILSIINSSPGNGHLTDLFEWFSYACKRSNLPLRIRAFTNEKFKFHLIKKCGFVLYGEDVQKYFT